MDIVRLLIANGAGVNEEKLEFGCTGLYLAAIKGHGKVVKRLLKSGANVDEVPSLYTYYLTFLSKVCSTRTKQSKNDL